MRSKLICMVPKIKEPRRLKYFKHMSLSNTVSRIFSKVIAIRATTIIHNIILAKQGAFIKGRLITENIALTQELVQNMDKKLMDTM